MYQGQIVIQDNLKYKLDVEKKTASLFSKELGSFLDVLIPRSIQYGTDEYVITTIEEHALSCVRIRSLVFPPDSGILKIKACSFNCTEIDNFTFPPNVEELEEYWNQGLSINQFNVLPSCTMYSKYGEDYILGKSDKKSDVFDVLVLARNEVDQAIPPFIKVIGHCSFMGLNLSKIEFSENSELETIENLAFAESSLPEITFPPHLKKICESAFKNCYQLTTVDFEQNSELQIIEKKAFFGSSVKKFTIPNDDVILEEGWCDYTIILDVKFQPNCKNFTLYNKNLILRKSDPKSDIFDVLILALKNIQHAIIPPFVKVIGPHAFNFCRKLHGVIFKRDSQCHSIEKGAFSYSKVRKVKFPPHLTTIKSRAFYNCKKLNCIEFAENSELKTIGDYAFETTSIQKVEFPHHLKIIEIGAFAHCSKLNSIEFDEDSELQTINKAAFCGCSFLEVKLPLHVTSLNPNSFGRNENLQFFNIPENCELKQIERDVFSENKIESFTISSNIEKIDGSILYGIRNLKEIKISPRNKIFTLYEDNLVLQKSDPKSDIYDILFYANRSIQNITIPPFIKVIGDYAFFQNTNLNSVEIPINSELEIIGKSAFSLTAIIEFKVPPKLKKIDDDAFFRCYSLESFEIPLNSELEIIGQNAFESTKINKIFIPRKVEALNINVFKLCTNLEQITFAENSELQIIKENALYKTSIVNVKLPSHLKKIEVFAFYDCTFLKSIDFEENSELKTIEKIPFIGSSIEELTIPSKVTNLELRWSDGLQYLRKIKLMPDCEIYKLYNNDLLLSKSCPKSDIFDVILLSCRHIQQIEIPSFIKIIESNAFQFCKNLKKLYFQKNSQLEYIGLCGLDDVRIKFFVFPPHLKQVAPFSFNSDSIVTVTIPPNSEIKSICANCLKRGGIKAISLPLHLLNICETLVNVQLFQITGNSELDNLDKYALYNSRNGIIMVSPKNRENFEKVITLYNNEKFLSFFD